MSAGRFLRTFYQADNNEVHPIRVQPETASLSIGGTTNAPPSGPATVGISARATAGNRRIGLSARAVTVVFDEGSEPAGYAANSPIRIPILTPATYASISPGEAGTYLGAPVTVIGLSPERRR